jgi:hypothetical protein
MIDSVDFAKYLVWRAKELEEQYHVQYELGPTKLNEIMYICESILLAYGINSIKGKCPGLGSRTYLSAGV